MALLASPVPLPNKMFSGYDRPRPKYKRRHGALDFKVPVGTDVYAIESGTVKRAADGRGSGRGIYVEISHAIGPYKAVSRYLHLSKLLVKAGDKVTRGQRIALSGATDAKGLPHLHLDLRIPKATRAAYEAQFGAPAKGWVVVDDELLVPLEALVPISGAKERKPKPGGPRWLIPALLLLIYLWES